MKTSECELEQERLKFPKVWDRNGGSRFRSPPKPSELFRDLCDERLIIYERQTSVFNPLTGMKIMKVKTSPVMDPRLKQSKADLTVSLYIEDGLHETVSMRHSP